LKHIQEELHHHNDWIIDYNWMFKQEHNVIDDDC
jgi:hypothetical protein